ncbi:MAG: diadenylate cyclase, partial [Planctomycetia bacterium]
MNKLTLAMIRHGAAIAKELGANALVFDADRIDSSLDGLAELLQEIDFRTLLVTRERELTRVGNPDLVSVLHIPNVPLTRLALIKVAVLVGVAEKKIERGDLAVCLSGEGQSERLDMIVAIKVGDEPEFFVSDDSHPLPHDVQPGVFERVLSIASELAIEGREHRPVGALFIVGDSDRVLENSRQLILNPFQGYPEVDRNLLSDGLDETIKEFAAIDGAFVIRGDGVVLAAGRYLMPRSKGVQ